MLSPQTNCERLSEIVRQPEKQSFGNAWLARGLPCSGMLPQSLKNVSGSLKLVGTNESRHQRSRPYRYLSTAHWKRWILRCLHWSPLAIWKGRAQATLGGAGRLFKANIEGNANSIMTSQVLIKRSQDIRNEVELCVNAKHDHVLAFLGTCFIDGHVHWVSPYISNGNLAEYLNKNPLFDRIRMVSRENLSQRSTE